MKTIWGMSGRGHDASIAVMHDGKFVFEDYTNEKEHHPDLIENLLIKYDQPELVVWYENPWKKMLRQWWDGHKNVYQSNNVKKYLRSRGITSKYVYLDHHKSHASHIHESPYRDAIVIVADSIGDLDCTSIWYRNKRVSSINYPHSIGLFYSSMVQAAKMTPNKDEAKFEKEAKKHELNLDFKQFLLNRYVVDHEWAPLFKENLHKGTSLIGSKELIAPATQSIFEDMITKIYNHWTHKLQCDSVIFSGGCAFNRSIREKIDIWVPNNPGDGGSARSCVLGYLNA